MLADLHVHTALSPCADDEMTPNNIANMAVLSGLNAIAVTDHNSCRNVSAVIGAVVNAGLPLTVVPGIEASSMEEVHVVCLFPETGAALEFGAWIENGLPGVKNKPGIFGEQLIIDEKDNITGSLEHLLVAATSYGINEIVDKALSMGGVAYPAHVDREQNGIFTYLGYIPPDLNIKNVEISRNVNLESYIKARPDIEKFNHIRATDAHQLADIGEGAMELPLPPGADAAEIVGYLRQIHF